MQTLVAERVSSVDSFAINKLITKREQNSMLGQAFGSSFEGIVSLCPRMHKVFSIIKKIARTDSTALILGETGTGKELVARAIHRQSGRKGSLVPVNCGAIPEDILESELFGHERGAFTGAVSSRIGRFQMAEGGTIFLDEIGEMSPKLQVKLLRVLQERVVEPVGSTRSVKVDVRIIAATNKDLRDEVKAGRFREDLYYRLQVIPIQLPSLTQRGDDIDLLIKHFVERNQKQLSVDRIVFSDAALTALKAYQWPGNVRELENIIERVTVLSDNGLIDLNDLPDHISRTGDTAELAATTIVNIDAEFPTEGLDFNQVVEQFENRLITVALCRTSGNKKAAAELLKLNRTTLVEKIKKKGLVVAEQEQTDETEADRLFT